MLKGAGAGATYAAFSFQVWLQNELQNDVRIKSKLRPYGDAPPKI